MSSVFSKKSLICLKNFPPCLATHLYKMGSIVKSLLQIATLCVPREGTESEVDSGYKLGRAGSDFFLSSERNELGNFGQN